MFSLENFGIMKRRDQQHFYRRDQQYFYNFFQGLYWDLGYPGNSVEAWRPDGQVTGWSSLLLKFEKVCVLSLESTAMIHSPRRLTDSTKHEINYTSFLINELPVCVFVPVIFPLKWQGFITEFWTWKMSTCDIGYERLISKFTWSCQISSNKILWVLNTGNK